MIQFFIILLKSLSLYMYLSIYTHTHAHTHTGAFYVYSKMSLKIFSIQLKKICTFLKQMA